MSSRTTTPVVILAMGFFAGGSKPASSDSFWTLTCLLFKATPVLAATGIAAQNIHIRHLSVGLELYYRWEARRRPRSEATGLRGQHVVRLCLSTCDDVLPAC